MKVRYGTEIEKKTSKVLKEIKTELIAIVLSFIIGIGVAHYSFQFMMSHAESRIHDLELKIIELEADINRVRDDFDYFPPKPHKDLKI